MLMSIIKSSFLIQALMGYALANEIIMELNSFCWENPSGAPSNLEFLFSKYSYSQYQHLQPSNPPSKIYSSQMAFPLKPLPTCKALDFFAFWGSMHNKFFPL